MLSYQLLTDRKVLSLSGQDVKAFLQGLITNDINKLSPTNSIYSLILTPQGRFMADFFLVEYQGNILLDCYASFVRELKDYLEKYILRHDIKITFVDYQVGAMERFDDLANKTLGASIVLDNVIYYVDPRFKSLGIRLITLQNLTASRLDQTVELKYHELGIPQGHIDLISGEAFPLEFGMDYLHAIDFEKGCYLGQELTARTKHRGVVRKKVYKATGQSELPNVRTEILAGDKKLGVLCSACENSGIALIRAEDLESVEDKTTIHINNQPISLQLSDIYNENKC